MLKSISLKDRNVSRIRNITNNKVKDLDDERIDIKLINTIGKPIRFEKNILIGRLRSKSTQDENQ